MKKVFGSHDQTAHVWAQQTFPEGRASDKRIFFEGKTIYSYGRHFPMAHFHTPDLVYINADGYSTSTAKHKGIIRRAVSHKITISVPGKVLENIIFGQDKKHISTQLTEWYSKNINANLQKAALANKLHRQKYIDNAAIGMAEAERFNKVSPYKVILSKLPKTEKFDYEAYKEKQLAERKATLERKKDAIRDAVEKFRAGSPHFDAYLLPHVMLRIVGDLVQTSKRAEFPLTHAKKAFKQILACNQSGTEWKRNGKKIPVGNFQIDSIDTFGNVTAGCHIVPFTEILRLTETAAYING